MSLSTLVQNVTSGSQTIICLFTVFVLMIAERKCISVIYLNLLFPIKKGNKVYTGTNLDVHIGEKQ